MNEQTPKPSVLIIDDEIQIRRLLRFTLEDAGYEVREVEAGRPGLVEAAHHRPDVIVLDLGLPDMSGIDVLKRLREWSQTPVLILSVFGEESRKIEALDAGADDYLIKPFGGGELLARLRALLRRIRPNEPPATIRFGTVEVDLANRRVTKAGELVKLSVKEYAILRLLVSHQDKVLTHRQILTEVWGPGAEEQTHYLRVFMMRLRKKIEDDPNTPRYIQTESSIGYRLLSDSHS
ncbi:response regulator [Termitidicoccus mucosus]|uniref:Two-component system response regulator n=1 Tax=Termitidicoccus mucosus TaxID=1184151 RepID=A0A178IER7_9BACT|nr:two-component system response regulator [Opitutaceae bacterium TSB47]